MSDLVPGVVCGEQAIIAERDRLRAALQFIRDNYGRVCGEFEFCDHTACNSSYGAWVVADEALRGSGKALRGKR